MLQLAQNARTRGLNGLDLGHERFGCSPATHSHDVSEGTSPRHSGLLRRPRPGVRVHYRHDVPSAFWKTREAATAGSRDRQAPWPIYAAHGVSTGGGKATGGSADSNGR